MSELKGSSIPRRTFLKTSIPAAGALTFSTLGVTRVLGAAQGSDRIRVGIIGTGGRGTGAGKNCIESSPGVSITAVADLLPEQAAKAAKQIQVAPDRVFSGLEAYQKLVKTDVDMVILAAPPGFRPIAASRPRSRRASSVYGEASGMDPVGAGRSSRCPKWPRRKSWRSWRARSGGTRPATSR